MFRRRPLVLLLLVIGLAATGFWVLRSRAIPDAYNPVAPLDLAAAPNFVTPAKLWLIKGRTAACVAALARVGVVAVPMPLRIDKPACQRRGTVMVNHLWKASLKPLEMRCDITLRLYLLERHAIQPLALAHFGQPVARIDDFGSYSCRTIRGSSWMSEHATANAYDLAGFRLANGRMISVKKDWRAGDAAANFVPEVRDAACRLFNMVLSPDYNADHHDHLHLDMGLLRGCH